MNITELITQNYWRCMVNKKLEKLIPHPQISEVKLVRDLDIFPISWLHKQEYCEYQIYLENMKGVVCEQTKAIIEGKQEHERLDIEFKDIAVPTTFAEAMVQSKAMNVRSRKLPVISLQYGIYGLIDEVHFTPNKFIVIDDKPGTKAYLSNIHQVYGYCLAFKERVKHDHRQIVAALRERGTDNINWNTLFDEKAEDEVIGVVNHIHELISGKKQFRSNKNPNKCKACKCKKNCDRVLL